MDETQTSDANGESWGLTFTLPLIGCVASGKSLTVSDPWFHPFQNRNSNIPVLSINCHNSAR